MNKTFLESVARNLGMRCQIESDRYCSLLDIEDGLVMTIEFYDMGGMWIWTSQTVVGDLKEDVPDALDLLKRNNDELVWCYYVVKSFEEGGQERHSLNLKYSFGTSTGNPDFARGRPSPADNLSSILNEVMSAEFSAKAAYT